MTVAARHTYTTNCKNRVSHNQVNNRWFWSQSSKTVLSLMVLFPIYCIVTVVYYTYSLTQRFNFIPTIMSVSQGIFRGSLLCSVAASVLLWEMQKHFFKVPAAALCWLKVICLVQREASNNASYPADTAQPAAFKWLRDWTHLIASGCTSGHQIPPIWSLIPGKCPTERLLILTYTIRDLQYAAVCWKITGKKVRVQRHLSRNVSQL